MIEPGVLAVGDVEGISTEVLLVVALFVVVRLAAGAVDWVMVGLLVVRGCLDSPPVTTEAPQRDLAWRPAFSPIYPPAPIEVSLIARFSEPARFGQCSTEEPEAR